MASTLHLVAPAAHGSRQIPLPLELTNGPAMEQPVPRVIPVPVRQVWAGLSPALQAQIRQTVLHIAQEVTHDRPQH